MALEMTRTNRKEVGNATDPGTSVADNGFSFRANDRRGGCKGNGEGEKMIKVMVFFDGSWLDASSCRLGRENRLGGFQINFGALKDVIVEHLREQLGCLPVDIVRQHFFASVPTNYNPQDEDQVLRKKAYLNRLAEKYRFDLKLFDLEYRGRRIRQEDRDSSDAFVPVEKCVDVALACEALELAYLPSGYDIAVFVAGDLDYLPAMKKIRKLGKRVALVSSKTSCAKVYRHCSGARAIDFDVIWLDDFLERISWTNGSKNNRSAKRRPSGSNSGTVRKQRAMNRKKKAA
jgi:NYN domain-containing protein